MENMKAIISAMEIAAYAEFKNWEKEEKMITFKTSFDKREQDRVRYHYSRYIRLSAVSEWLKTGKFPDKTQTFSREAYEDMVSHYINFYSEQSFSDILIYIEDGMLQKWAKKTGTTRWRRNLSKSIIDSCYNEAMCSELSD